MRRFASIASIVILLAATGCGSLPSWMGGKKPPGPKLPGERVAVLAYQNTIEADPALQSMPVTVPAETANADWPQAGQNASGHIDHVAFAGAFAGEQRADAGKGNGWESIAIPAPVVADGKAFALDGKAYVSAHDGGNLARLLWVSDSVAAPDSSEVIGGGLAYGEGRLYVVSGNGKVAALDGATGKPVWVKALNLPLRSAPRLFENTLFVASLDNQLFALNAADGNVVWSHRGISEAAGFLDIVTPAADSGVVVVAYSSGEIHALRSGSGEEVWSDSLALPRRTVATALLTGVSGDPVIAGGLVYAAGNGGVMAAGNLTNGRRVWEQEISAVHTPWVAGDFVYVVTSDHRLVAVRASDGRVRWVQSLPAVKEARASHWGSPMLAGGKLVVPGVGGRVLLYDPASGNLLGERAIAPGIMSAPVIAGGVFYLLGQDGTLHSYR